MISSLSEKTQDLPLQNSKAEGSRDGGQTDGRNKNVAPAPA
jgi:hypothetical protein